MHVIHRKCVSSVGALLVAVAVVACGSDDANIPAVGQPSSQPTTTAPEPSAVPTTTQVPDVAPPTPDLLQDSLVRLVDPAIPAQDKAGLVVDGQTRVEALAALTTGLDNYGRITFVVSGVDVAGTSATAKVDVTGPHGTIPINMTWDKVGEAWQLSGASTCNLLAMGRVQC